MIGRRIDRRNVHLRTSGCLPATKSTEACCPQCRDQGRNFDSDTPRATAAASPKRAVADLDRPSSIVGRLCVLRVKRRGILASHPADSQYESRRPPKPESIAHAAIEHASEASPRRTRFRSAHVECAIGQRRRISKAESASEVAKMRKFAGMTNLRVSRPLSAGAPHAAIKPAGREARVGRGRAAAETNGPRRPAAAAWCPG